MTKREQIQLLYTEGFNIKDISELTDVDLGTVSYEIYKYRKSIFNDTDPKSGANAVLAENKQAQQKQAVQTKPQDTAVKKAVENKGENKGNLSGSVAKTESLVKLKYTEKAKSKSVVQQSDKTITKIEDNNGDRLSGFATKTEEKVAATTVDVDVKHNETNDKPIVKQNDNASVNADNMGAVIEKENNVNDIDVSSQEGNDTNNEQNAEIKANDKKAACYKKGTISKEMQDIIKMFADGVSVKEIAAAKNKKVSTISRYMYKYLDRILELNPQFTVPEQQKGTDGLFNMLTNADAIYDKIAKGVSCAEVAAEYKVQSVRSLKGFLLKNISKIYEKNPDFDIAALKNTDADTHTESTAAEQRTNEILHCIANKEDFEDIAKKYDIQSKSLYYLRRTHIAEILNINPDYITRKEKQILQCLSQGLSVRDTAHKCEVIELTVNQVKARYASVMPMLLNTGVLETIAPMQADANVRANIHKDTLQNNTAYGDTVQVDATKTNTVHTDTEHTDTEHTAKQADNMQTDIIAALEADIKNLCSIKDSAVRGRPAGVLHESTIMVLKDLVAGKPIDFIAFEHSKTKQNVNNIKKRYKELLEKYNPNLPKDYKRAFITPTGYNQLIQQIANGMSCEDASNAFKLDIASVIKYCTDNTDLLLQYNANFDVNSISKKYIDQVLQNKKSLNEILKQETVKDTDATDATVVNAEETEYVTGTNELPVNISYAVETNMETSISAEVETNAASETVDTVKPVATVKPVVMGGDVVRDKSKAVIRVVGVTETAKPAKKVRKLHSLWRQRRRQTLRNLQKLKKRREK